MAVKTIERLWRNWLHVNFRAAIELQNEAKSHKLDHVNVVKLYAMVFERNHYGVVLEYVPNGGLDVFLSVNSVRWLMSLHTFNINVYTVTAINLKLYFSCIFSTTHHQEVFHGRLVWLVPAWSSVPFRWSEVISVPVCRTSSHQLQLSMFSEID